MYSVFLHDILAYTYKSIGVRHSRRFFKRAIDKNRIEIAKIVVIFICHDRAKKNKNIDLTSIMNFMLLKTTSLML